MSTAKTCLNCNRKFEVESDFLNHSNGWTYCEKGNFWFTCECGSTLMLQSKKVGWFSFHKVLSEEAKSILSKYPSLNKIPQIPNALMRLKQKIDEENSTVADLAEILRELPVLGAEVVKLANNYKPKSMGQIKSIEHAAGYLGKVELDRLVLLSFFSLIKPMAKTFNEEMYWVDCFLTGAIAEKLGANLNSKYSADELFLAGSLCNVGILVLGAFLPDEFDSLSQTLNEAPIGTLLIDVEEKFGYPNHQVLGEIAAKLWGLDESLVDAIKDHHSASLEITGDSLTNIIVLSNQIKHWVNSDPDKLDENLLKAAREKLGLKYKQLQEFVDIFLSQRAAL